MRYPRTSARARGYDRDWEKLRAYHLAGSPLCVFCMRDGKLTPANVVDHIKPFRDDWSLRLDPGNLQSLCKPCHDSEKQREENELREAYHAEGKPIVQEDGWVVHPKRWGYSIPDGLRASAVKVYVVVGPPGSGKTTYVRERADQWDKVIDLDELKIKAGGRKYDTDGAVFSRAMKYRDLMIRSLADDQDITAWLIVTAPTKAERLAWLEALGALAELVTIDTDSAECIRRIASDPERRHCQASMIQAVQKWER